MYTIACHSTIKAISMAGLHGSHYKGLAGPNNIGEEEKKSNSRKHLHILRPLQPYVIMAVYVHRNSCLTIYFPQYTAVL